MWIVKRVSPCCSLVSPWHQTVKHNPVGGPSVIYSVRGPSDETLLSCSIYVHSLVGVQCWSLVHWTNALLAFLTGACRRRSAQSEAHRAFDPTPWSREIERRYCWNWGTRPRSMPNEGWVASFNLCGWLNVFPLVVHSFHIKLSSTIQLEDLLWFIRLEVLPIVHSFHIKLYNPVGGPAVNYSIGGPSD